MALSERQSKMLNFIKVFTLENGFPPTVRDIGEAVSISSTSVVDYNLKALQRKGLLRRAKGVSRGLQVIEEKRRQNITHLISVPMLGHIAAGSPIDSPESAYIDEYLDVPSDMLPKQTDGLYALKVKGNSMIDALINDGDTVIMRYTKEANNGDMVAVWLTDRDEMTLKRLYREDKQIRLQPENATMKPFYVDPGVVQVQGKVVAVMRSVN
jgi:repressor LexA